jgi:hypothetical protein
MARSLRGSYPWVHLRNSIVRHATMLRHAAEGLIWALGALLVGRLVTWAFGFDIGVPVALVFCLLFLWVVVRLDRLNFRGGGTSTPTLIPSAHGTWALPPQRKQTKRRWFHKSGTR